MFDYDQSTVSQILPSNAEVHILYFYKIKQKLK